MEKYSSTRRKESMIKTAIVNSKELCTNCWLAKRFTGGSRCCRVMACTYPEKCTCKAVDAEIEYLQNQKQTLTENIAKKVDTLQKMKGGKN
jgi:hypothetical protein